MDNCKGGRQTPTNLSVSPQRSASRNAAQRMQQSPITRRQRNQGAQVMVDDVSMESSSVKSSQRKKTAQDQATQLFKSSDAQQFTDLI